MLQHAPMSHEVKVRCGERAVEKIPTNQLNVAPIVVKHFLRPSKTSTGIIDSCDVSIPPLGHCKKSIGERSTKLDNTLKFERPCVFFDCP